MLLERSGSRRIYGLYDLDNIDERIIALLKEDGRASFAAIAEEIGLPPSTVRDRVNRMVESGLLRVVALVNPMHRGQQARATVGVNLSGGDHRAIAEQISALELVTEVVICAGRFDLMLELTCKDNAQLLETIAQVRAIDGVRQAETFMHFASVKDDVETFFPGA